MKEKNLSLEFRLKDIGERIFYFLLLERKEKFFTTLYYIKRFLILASAITGCISLCSFASLLGVPIAITRSAIRLQICEIAAGI